MTRHQRRKKAILTKARLISERLAGENAIKVRAIVKANLCTAKPKQTPRRLTSNVYDNKLDFRAIGGHRPLYSIPNAQVKK